MAEHSVSNRRFSTLSSRCDAFLQYVASPDSLGFVCGQRKFATSRSTNRFFFPFCNTIRLFAAEFLRTDELPLPPRIQLPAMGIRTYAAAMPMAPHRQVFVSFPSLNAAHRAVHVARNFFPSIQLLS